MIKEFKGSGLKKSQTQQLENSLQKTNQEKKAPNLPGLEDTDPEIQIRSEQ